VKCKRWGGGAVVEVRCHDAAFCGHCFVHQVTEQVRRSIRSFGMIAAEAHVLVAVSGGKDLCCARAQVLGERLGPPPAEQLARELAEEVLPVEVYGG
jgi:hypothetical protein